MTHSLSKSHVILVDDESINLTIMELSLQERDCQVTKFSSGAKCLEFLKRHNLRNFDCLVTDYSMPGMNGIDLLEQIKRIDPSLEIILITGENERKIIQESLRKGAFDFLDKPINLDKFYTSIERAVIATSKRRKKSATEKSLMAARSTGLFNHIKISSWEGSVDLIYAPRHELGGDFIDVFESDSGSHHVIFGDVSGHDIQSALLSAHFMGTLNGRRSVESPINPAALFSSYNTLLIERGSKLHAATSFEFGSSLSICCLDFAAGSNQVQITNCGVPDIYLVDTDSSVRRVSPQFQPLGWFEGLEYESSNHAIDSIHTILGFTDGLVEFAHKHHWDILSLAYYIDSLSKDDREKFLNSAEDDVLLLKIQFKKEPLQVIPILHESYRGNEAHNVDRFQNQWQQSFKLSLPDAQSEKLDRFLLACREAVLNALNHGCEKRVDRMAQLSIAWNPSEKQLSAVVSDPGEGHNFDPELRDRQLKDLKPGNLGLLLISKLVDHVDFKDNGATIEMRMTLDT
jgi:FixJ family two-component response regulator/anti-sigma regulatory factor (Ser/Thr protein kinase)